MTTSAKLGYGVVAGIVAVSSVLAVLTSTGQSKGAPFLKGAPARRPKFRVLVQPGQNALAGFGARSNGVDDGTLQTARERACRRLIERMRQGNTFDVVTASDSPAIGVFPQQARIVLETIEVFPFRDSAAGKTIGPFTIYTQIERVSISLSFRVTNATRNDLVSTDTVIGWARESSESPFPIPASVRLEVSADLLDRAIEGALAELEVEAAKRLELAGWRCQVIRPGRYPQELTLSAGASCGIRVGDRFSLSSRLTETDELSAPKPTSVVIVTHVGAETCRVRCEPGIQAEAGDFVREIGKKPS